MCIRDRSYPLVFFVADASANINNTKTPLFQGNGATVWTEPEEQAKHPCIVLAPQYTQDLVQSIGMMTTDENVWTPGLTLVTHLLQDTIKNYAVDKTRIYGTGQSQGGMTNIAISDRYPDLFAAQWLVACQWNVQEMAAMKDKKLWITVCEGDNKAFPGMNEATALWESLGSPVARNASPWWNSKSPVAELDEQVRELAAQGKKINYTVFAGGNHMYTWSFAYGIDAIRDRHANQHIPMIVGALRSYRSNANPYYWHIADNFWDLVQGRYRYAMGGVGNGEMFRQPYKQMVSMATNPAGPDINETCCAYNLAKLTKDLNAYHPNDARYMDYYERVLYNQLVGSVNPREYAVLYQYAVGLNASKPWGNETPQATCCGGTGAENHVKYQEAAYFTAADTLWVALYLPTRATWQGLTLRQDCTFPAQRSVVRVEKGKKTFTMKLRVPYWATTGFSVQVNGKELADHYQPGSYVTIDARRWQKGDSVVVNMPFTRHLDFTPDKMDITRKQSYKPMWAAAFMNGPLVMAAKDVRSWDEATLSSEADADRLSFVPDYDADRHITHYFRIDGAIEDTAYVDTTTLTELLRVAEQRLAEQQAWDAMEKKVPEFAPWATNGIDEMRSRYEAAKAFVANHKGNGAVVASELNAALSMMRPGNLAEPADLKELLEALQAARAIAAPTQRLKDAMGYAEMVRDYVNDGSGTKDLIRRGLTGLRAAMPAN